MQRVGSSSRPVHRSSDVDYDAIPSPRAASTSSILRRPSIANARPSQASRLSQSTVGHQDFDDAFGAFEDDVPGPPSPDESENEPIMSPPRAISKRASFSQLARDSEERVSESEEEPPISHVTPKSAKSKGKQRYEPSPEPPDVPMLDDFGPDEFGDGGLPPIEEEPEPIESDEPEEPQEPGEETPRPTKPKRKDPPSPSKEKTRKKSRKENADPSKPRKRHDGILREGKPYTWVILSLY